MQKTNYLCEHMQYAPGRVAQSGRVSDCRYMSDCRSRGCELDHGQVSYFRGDRFYHYKLFTDIFQKFISFAKKYFKKAARVSYGLDLDLD